MLPWYRGFIGDIELQVERDNSYECSGILHKRSKTCIEVVELPIKKWTQDYKEFLGKLTPAAQETGKQDRAKIQDFREYHTENSVHFMIYLSEAQMRAAEEKGLETVFKMKTNIPLTNMMLFDKQGKIKKYTGPEQILKEFVEVRGLLLGFCWYVNDTERQVLNVNDT
jgi:DNA topoisomerase II